MDIQHTPPSKQEPTLVGIKTCLETVFPDEATRPSLRAFNDWRIQLAKEEWRLQFCQ